MGGLQDYRDQLEHLASIDRIRSLRPRVGKDFASNDYLALGAGCTGRVGRFAAAARE